MYHGGGARRDDEAEGFRKRGFRWYSLYQSPSQRESIPGATQNPFAFHLVNQCTHSALEEQLHPDFSP